MAHGATSVVGPISLPRVEQLPRARLERRGHEHEHGPRRVRRVESFPLQQNRDPLALEAPPRELAFNDRCRREYVDEFVGHTDLSERERKRLGAGVEELDLERAVVDRTLLPDQLVHPLFIEQTRAVLVNIGPSRRGG
jgi:hypothetical protein